MLCFYQKLRKKMEYKERAVVGASYNFQIM